MKLTNIIRDAFVRSVMNDVPTVDYSEQIREVVTKEAVAQLPEKVRALYNNSATKDYVATFWHGGKLSNAMIPGVNGVFKLSANGQKTIEAIEQKRAAQDAKNKELRSSVRAVAYSATTRKALADLLPEFAKYLPQDEAAAIKTLPVVANVVSSFVKAGWPKDKVKSAKAHA